MYSDYTNGQVRQYFLEPWEADELSAVRMATVLENAAGVANYAAVEAILDRASRNGQPIGRQQIEAAISSLNTYKWGESYGAQRTRSTLRAAKAQWR